MLCSIIGLFGMSRSAEADFIGNSFAYNLTAYAYLQAATSATDINDDLIADSLSTKAIFQTAEGLDERPWYTVVCNPPQSSGWYMTGTMPGYYGVIGKHRYNSILTGWVTLPESQESTFRGF